ncbi:MAG: hypothetical protein SNJ84_04840 [Verrucomicrobiia bacterium]
MRTAGFSLVEAVLALGLFSLLAIGLLAVLSSGLQSAQVAQADYRLHLLADNLQARLILEPDWPPLSGQASVTLGFDEAGNEQPVDQAPLLVDFQSIPHPHWSRHLEAFHVSIRRHQGEVLETFFLSRTLPTPTR